MIPLLHDVDDAVLGSELMCLDRVVAYQAICLSRIN